MLGRPAERLEELRQKLRAALSNYLTYPKTLIEIAGSRALKEEEIRKASILLDACLSALDSEMILLISEI